MTIGINCYIGLSRLSYLRIYIFSNSDTRDANCSLKDSYFSGLSQAWTLLVAHVNKYFSKNVTIPTQSVSGFKTLMHGLGEKR